MKTFLLIDTDGEIKEEKYDAKEDFLKFAYRNLECDCISCEYNLQKIFRQLGLIMIVDESGALVDFPIINNFATSLIASNEYAIYGKVFICKVKNYDFAGLNQDEILLIKQLNKLFEKLRKK